MNEEAKGINRSYLTHLLEMEKEKEKKKRKKKWLLKRQFRKAIAVLRKYKRS